MKELLITVGYFLLALLEGILYLLFQALVGGPLRLWEKALLCPMSALSPAARRDVRQYGAGI